MTSSPEPRDDETDTGHTPDEPGRTPSLGFPSGDPDPVDYGAGEPVRAVFRRALRDMIVLLAVLTVVGTAVGYAVAGPAGVWGALIGVGVTLVFSGTTVVTMLRTTDASVTTTGAVVLGGWLVKMVVLIAVFVALRGLTFYDRTVFVTVVLVGVLGAVLLDYRAVVRGRVPYTRPGAGRSS